MKKALLFGINDYPGERNDLNGCVNDVNDIAAKLKLFGFEQIDIFINEQVTCSKFESEILKMFREATKEDYLFIGYSGHGTQVADTNGDEADGYDEALFLFDGPFIDDRFNKILIQKRAGIPLFLNMDCCFSGTNTRLIDVKPRFKPIMAVELLDEAGNIKGRMRKRKMIRAREMEMDYVVLSGCAENQTSADAFFGKYNGAETYYAFNKALIPGISFNEWYKKIRKYLPSNNFPQIPQLEGPDWMLKSGVFGSQLVKKQCFLMRLFGIKSKPKPVEPIPPNPPTNPTKPPK